MMKKEFLFLQNKIFVIVYKKTVVGAISPAQNAHLLNVDTSAGKACLMIKDLKKKKDTFFNKIFRINRKWTYESIENEGSDNVVKNRYLQSL